MKRLFVLFSLCAVLAAGSSVQAQCSKDANKCQKNNKECGQKCHPSLMTPATVDLLKEAYLKENLKLNDNQKDAFWKSYNKYGEAQKQAAENKKQSMLKAGFSGACCKMDTVKPTDEKIVACHNIRLEYQQALLKAEQTFFNEISKNLSKEQVAQYIRLEKGFEMEMKGLMKKDCCKKGENAPAPAHGMHGGCQGR